MGLVERVMGFVMPKPWPELPERKKNRKVGMAHYNMCVYASTAASRRIFFDDEMREFIGSYVPNLGQDELKAILDAANPETEIDDFNYFVGVNDALLGEPCPVEELPFYQHLSDNVDSVIKLRWEKNLTVYDFHYLLGMYFLDQAQERGLIHRDIDEGRMVKTYQTGDSLLN